VVLVERPRAKPNAVVEVRRHLADGTPVKVVWAWLPMDEMAKLVTVHFFDSVTHVAWETSESSAVDS
jgi:hypothetical protein